MALYIVSHKRFSRKQAEIELFFDPHGGMVTRSQQDLACVLFKKKTNSKFFIKYGELIFKLKETPSNTPTQNDGVVCDKDWCDACKKGNYERCPNQK